jgi:DNA-binding MarR family transcriptional regulator
MNGLLPLPTLLSQALVAFTIEFDNEFEHQVPHRTTNHGSTGGAHSAPWLVSMVMWLKVLRFVPADGIPAQELQQLTRMTGKEMRIWLTRLEKWWGYLVIEPDAAAIPSKRAGSASLIRPTPGGRKALEAWRPLTGIIEKRWRQRLGKDVIDWLEEALQLLIEKLDRDLPDCLPILGYELLSQIEDGKGHTPRAGGPAPSQYTLPMLLSKVLLAFAAEFERESGLSLAISANVLRLIGDGGVRLRDLPRLSAVSKEAIAVSVGRLEERGFAVVEPESPGSRVKTLRLTPKGRRAQETYKSLVWAIEERWQANFGEDTVRNLRQLLERLIGEPTAQASPLFRGLEPYPDGWRAAVPRPDGLPHYPMVLHRGGFPDGS